MGYGFGGSEEPLEPVEEPVEQVEKPVERYGPERNFGTRGFGFGNIIPFLILILLFSGSGFGGYNVER